MKVLSQWLQQMGFPFQTANRALQKRVDACLAEVAKAPSLPGSHLRLGEALEASGDAPRAFLAYRRAAWLYRIEGKAAAADIAHKRALSLMPGEDESPENVVVAAAPERPRAKKPHLRIVSNASTPSSVEITQVNFPVGAYEEDEPVNTDESEAPPLDEVATEGGENFFPSMQKTEIYSFDPRQFAQRFESPSDADMQRLIRVTRRGDFVGQEERASGLHAHEPLRRASGANWKPVDGGPSLMH